MTPSCEHEWALAGHPLVEFDGASRAYTTIRCLKCDVSVSIQCPYEGDGLKDAKMKVVETFMEVIS